MSPTVAAAAAAAAAAATEARSVAALVERDLGLRGSAGGAPPAPPASPRPAWPRHAVPGRTRLQQWLPHTGAVGKPVSEQEDASLGSKRGRPRSPQTASEDLADLEAAAALQLVVEVEKPGPQSPKKLPIWARPKWKPAKPCSQPAVQPRARQLRNPPRKELRDDMVELSGALSQPPSKGPVFPQSARAAQTTSSPAERKPAGRQSLWAGGEDGGGGDELGGARRYSDAPHTARGGFLVRAKPILRILSPPTPRQKKYVQGAGEANESELQPTTPGRSPRKSIYAKRVTVDPGSLMQGERSGLGPGMSGGSPQTQDAPKDGKSKFVGLEFRKKKTSMDEEASGEQLSKEVRVAQLAQQLRVPQDILRQAYEIFEESCQAIRLEQAKSKLSRRDSLKFTVEHLDSEFDVIKDGELSEEGFSKVLCRITGCEDVSELPPGLLVRSFNDADGDRSRTIKFLEFALWYARHGFMENVLLTNAQRQVRALARKYDLPIIEVEQYKKTFDRVDEDGNGTIEPAEFAKCLETLIKVPAQCELPASRVKQFWKEADVNQDGVVTFEEFLIFYNRYFRIKKNGSTTCPIEEYYRGIRRVPLTIERY